MLKLKLSKTLSKNDTGETHSHQSGISIPKAIANEGIFPKLGMESLNPRVTVAFVDEEENTWLFQYIYYNDVFFGKERSKAHNEFRLTCVKDYIRHNSIQSGDDIWFGIEEDGTRRIGFTRAATKNNYGKDEEGNVVISIKGGWHYVKY